MRCVIKKKRRGREGKGEGSLTSDFRLPDTLAFVPMRILNVKKSRSR